MKTFNSIRIGMMSIVALLAIASSIYAHTIDACLYIDDSTGKRTTVKINHDGTFQTPPLAAGTYSFSWGVGRSLMGGSGSSSSSGGASDRSVSSGGDRPQESIKWTFLKIEWTYEVKNPRDAGSGLPTGKRMHKPITITKEIDKASPKLMTALGTITIDTKGETISGTVMGIAKNGNKAAMDSWDAK